MPNVNQFVIHRSPRRFGVGFYLFCCGSLFITGCCSLSRTPEEDITEVNRLLEQRIKIQDQIINDLRRDHTQLLKDFAELHAIKASKQGETDED